jgi:regulator of sigma E protease
MPLTVVSFILVMSVLVFVHELGHFLAARRNKIVVEEFGFGFPPRVIKLAGGDGTIYSINAIPFGGFVRLRGEDDPSQPGSLAAAPKLARAAVLLAGVTMNFLLAIVLFAALAMLTGVPDYHTPGAVVTAVAPGSPAEQAGLQLGDHIVAVNDAPIVTLDDLKARTQVNLGRPTTYRFVRPATGTSPAQTLEVSITPRANPPANEGPLGIGITPPIRRPTVWEATWEGVRTTAWVIQMTVQIPATLIREGRPISDAGLMGPVGIANETGKVVRSALKVQSVEPILWFMGLLSTALGFTNLLPVPGLDGGRLLFVLLEAIRRRRVAPAQEGLVHLIGFGMLLILVGVVTVREVASLLNDAFPIIGIR